MKWTTPKACAVGAAILVVAHGLWWGVAAGVQHAGYLRILLFVLPVLAAFAVTYLSPTHRVAAGMSMGVVGAVVGIASMVLYKHLGYHIDEIGSPLETFGILLVLHLLYAAVGTGLGYGAWRLRSRSLSA